MTTPTSNTPSPNEIRLPKILMNSTAFKPQGHPTDELIREEIRNVPESDARILNLSHPLLFLEGNSHLTYEDRMFLRACFKDYPMGRKIIMILARSIDIPVQNK